MHLNHNFTKSTCSMDALNCNYVEQFSTSFCQSRQECLYATTSRKAVLLSTSWKCIVLTEKAKPEHISSLQKGGKGAGIADAMIMVRTSSAMRTKSCNCICVMGFGMFFSVSEPL